MKVVVIALAAVILSLSLRPSRSDDTTPSSCTLCHLGSALFDPAATFGEGGIQCSEVSAVIGATPAEDPLCSETQIKAYQYCGCQTYPADEYCSMCPATTGSTGESLAIGAPAKEIPALGGKTCADVLFLPKSEHICQVLQSFVAHFCECPGLLHTDPEPACTFCLSNDDGDDGSSSSLMYPDRLLPPYFDTTCQEYAEQANNLNLTECLTLGADLAVDVRAYCGCGGTIESGDYDSWQPHTLCDPCAASQQDETETTTSSETVVPLTCEQIQDMANFVTGGDSFCKTLQQQSVSCCAVTSQAPSPASSNDDDKNTRTEQQSDVSRAGLASSFIILVATIL